MSKLMLFDFECTSCGHIREELVDPECRGINCTECDGAMARQISNVRLDWRRMGVDPDFATCADKWAKMQERKSREEEGYNLKHY